MLRTKCYNRRWGTLVLILAYLSIGLMPVGEGAVFCRGADGRVEMKTGYGGSCRPPTISSQGSGAAESVERCSLEDCCGPCDDTPLVNQGVSAYLRAKKKTSHTDGPYCWTKTSPGTAFDFVRKHSPGQPWVSADPVLFALRTVVLLI